MALTAAEDTGSRPPVPPVRVTARALYRLLPRRLRRGWALLALLAGLCSLAELVATAVLLGVIRLATQPAGAPRVLLRWPAEAPLVVAGGRTALLIAALVAAVFLIRAGLAVALATATSSSTVATGIFLSETLLSHYVHMPYVRLRQRRLADLHRLVTHMAKTVVSQVFRPGVQLATDALVIASVLAVMVIASPWGTLAAATLVIGVGLALMRAVMSSLYRSSAQIEQHDRSAGLFVDQVLRGRREITLRHHEAPVVASYQEERRPVLTASRRRAMLLDLPRIVIEGVTMTVVCGLIIFAIGLELDTPRVVATLGLFAYALLRLMPLAARLATNLASFRAGLPILDLVLEDVLAASERATPAARAPASPAVAVTAAPFGALEFRHVWSSYQGSRHPALRDVTVRIEAGSFVAIVGPSGAGKTTFVDLLLGLLVPTSGEVLMDGRPLRDFADGWQAGVGVVSQEPYIFNDSVLRNIVLFADTVDERRVIEVLDEVGLRELVVRLPQGLETQIGERGSRLSGGQRQRLAVARALYSDPALLVLDEATSALDPDGEATILKAALGHGAARTLLVVTHRASAIVDCDQVIVLEDGVVTAVGAYADVRERSAYFSRLVSAPAGARR